MSRLQALATLAYAIVAFLVAAQVLTSSTLANALIGAGVTLVAALTVVVKDGLTSQSIERVKAAAAVVLSALVSGNVITQSVSDTVSGLIAAGITVIAAALIALRPPTRS